MMVTEVICFFKKKSEYGMRISDWSSDVCSSDLADAGFKSVIINRPDLEGGPQQPLSADVMAAARAAGLAVEYQPVVGSAMTQDDVVRFAEILKELPAPVLAYCRTGTRCTHLFNAARSL